MDSIPFVGRQPRVASVADAATKLAAKALQEPMVTIRAESEELGLDFQLSLPVTDQKCFPSFITELAQAITRGTALNMRQSIEMRAWEHGLVRNKELRRERHEFYAEVQKNFEQLSRAVQQMKRDYYREIDHLRDQLRARRAGRDVHPEEVIFFDPSGYQVPPWENIVELLDSRRKSRELESAQSGGGLSRLVPVQRLCKGCRDNFYASSETEVPWPVEISTQTEELPNAKNGEGRAETGHLVSRWAQTERSGAGPEMSEGSMQTDDGDLALRTSTPCPVREVQEEQEEYEEQNEQKEQKEQREEEAPAAAQAPAAKAPAQSSVSVGVQAELTVKEDAGDTLLAASEQMERQSLRRRLKEAVEATEVSVAEARREKDVEWGSRLEALRRELEERMASAAKHMAAAAASDAAAVAVAAAAATTDAVQEAVSAMKEGMKEGISVGSDSQELGRRNRTSATSEDQMKSKGDSECSAASKGNRVASLCPKVSCNHLGSGLSLKQRKHMAARMLERRLAALQAHMQRAALARARLAAPQLPPQPSNAFVGGEGRRASVPCLSPPSPSQSPQPISPLPSPVPLGGHRPRSQSDPQVRPIVSSGSQAGGRSLEMEAAQGVSGSSWTSASSGLGPPEVGAFLQVQVKQMGLGSFGDTGTSSPAPQGRRPGLLETPSVPERGRRGPYAVQPPDTGAPMAARRRAPAVGWRSTSTEVAAPLGKSREPSPGGPPVSRGEVLGPGPREQMDFLSWASASVKERGMDVTGASEVMLPKIASGERPARSSSPALQRRSPPEGLPSLLANPRPRHKESAGGAQEGESNLYSD